MSGESGGLKQRKVAASSDAANSKYVNGGSNNENSNLNDNEKNDPDLDNQDDEEFDADSKETRLTLMEEILLLGLKDREVSHQSRFYDPWYNGQ